MTTPMSSKKEKKKKSKKRSFADTEEGSVLTSTTEPSKEETSLRKSSFLRAIQSDRITVLVSASEKPFQVPQDLLMQWSPPLGEMCRSGFEESQTRIIRLPHVKISTFEDFIIWVHAYEPCLDIEGFAPVLDLAIFAEMYMIYQLKNQTSDILREELASGQWKLTPEIFSMVYDEVPSSSILRELFFLSFALPSPFPSLQQEFGYAWGRSLEQSTDTYRKHDNYLEWQKVFEKHLDLGWEFFKQIQSSNLPKTIDLGGPCRFHDHRDIPGFKSENIEKCLYPRGPLPIAVSTHSQPIGDSAQQTQSVGEVGNFPPTVEELPPISEVEEAQPSVSVPFIEL